MRKKRERERVREIMCSAQRGTIVDRVMGAATPLNSYRHKTVSWSWKLTREEDGHVDVTKSLIGRC